jgi:hypothetical protein
MSANVAAMLPVPGCTCRTCLRLERALARYLDGVAHWGTLRSPTNYTAVRRALDAADRAHARGGQ